MITKWILKASQDLKFYSYLDCVFVEIICHPMMERKKIDMKEKRKRRIYFFRLIA